MDIAEIAKVGGSAALIAVLLWTSTQLWAAYQASVKRHIDDLNARIEVLEGDHDETANGK